MELSVVCPVFNEEAALDAFYQSLSRILEQMGTSYEIVFVNDGSKDSSLSIMREKAAADPHVRILDFARNFGHEAAMIAGIDYSRGEAIICMDSDLQHPTEMIPQMVQRWKEGFDIVNMVRTRREDDKPLHRFNSALFYKIVNLVSDVKIAENASDFFLISKPVAQVLKTDYRERTRFLRGLIQLVGYQRTTLEYVAAPRVAGESKYSFWKLLKLSFSAISSSSKMPLQIGIFAGLFFVLLSILLIIYSLVMWFLNRPVSGYTTLVVFMSAFAGIQLFVTGLIGLYIGYIFDEVKARPIYVVKEVIDPNEE